MFTGKQGYIIGLDKSGYQVNIFLISPEKHRKHLTEAFLMSTNNICFSGKIRKISILLD